MSKRSKIIIWIIFIVFILGGLGTFNYLYSTGKLRLKANSYDYANFYNPRATVSGGQSGQSIQVYPGQTISFSVDLYVNPDVPNGGLINPMIYAGLDDTNDTNWTVNTDTICESVVVTSGESGAAYEGNVKAGCDLPLTYSCYNKNAIYWTLQGSNAKIYSGRKVNFNFKAKIKDTAQPGTIIKRTYAAGWYEKDTSSCGMANDGAGGSHQTRIVGGETLITVIARPSATPTPTPPTPTPEPTDEITASKGEIMKNFNSEEACARYSSAGFPCYGYMNKMWIKNLSGARGVQGNYLLVYPGDKIQAGVQVVNFIKNGADGHNPNGLSGAGVYNAPQDPGNINFAKYTNWENADMDCSGNSCTVPASGTSCGWSGNIPYSNYSSPGSHGVGGYLWSIPADHLLSPDWCGKNVKLNVRVKSNAPVGATFQTGWSFGWYDKYKGGNPYAYQWSGDIYYPWLKFKVIDNPAPPPPPPPAKIIGEKTVDKNNARAGDIVTYTLLTKNTGGTTATNFVIKDNIAGITKYAKIESISDGGKQVGNEIHYTKTLAAGKQVLTQFKVKVNPTDQWPKDGNYKMLNSFQPSSDSPITNTTVNVGYTSIAAVNKSAFNETQNIPATTKNANPGDVIRYTLTTENTGNLPDTAYTTKEDIANILRYADVIDTGTGKVEGNTISWVITLPGKSQTVTTFKVKIKAADKWPTAGDLTMTNVYGQSTISVKIQPQSVPDAVVAPVVAAANSVLGTLSTLAKSGVAILIIIVVALLIIIIYFVVRYIIKKRKRSNK